MPAILAVVIAASLWGTTGTVAHFIPSSVGPVTIGAVTMGVGGLVLALVSWRLTRSVIRSAPLRIWWRVGSLGVVVYPLAFYSGMDLAGVAVGNVLTLGTGPLVGAMLEWWVDRRPPRIRWWLAMGLGVTGVVILSIGERSQTTASGEFWGLGVALALLAGVAYGVFSYAMGKISSAGHSALASAGAVFGPASPILVLVALAGIGDIVSQPTSLIGLGYLVALPMVVSYLLYSRALATLAPSTVLTIALVEPAVATVLAVGVVGERFDLAGAAGIGLIVLAVVLAARARPLPLEGHST